MPARRQAIDIHVGKRLRQQRKAKGLTQSGLAEMLGVTYQQIQKYESGSNRIAAGRLQALAGALEVPVAFFFEEAPPGLLPAGYSDGAAEGRVSEEDLSDLTHAFLAIPSAPLRKGVLHLIELIADAPAGRK